MELFATFLNQIYPLEEELLNSFISKWPEVSFKRKEIITREGQIEKYSYFVLEGIQRSYYLKNDKEHVIAFTYAPSFQESRNPLFHKRQLNITWKQLLIPKCCASPIMNLKG